MGGTHLTLNGHNRTVRIDNCLPLGNLADDTFSLLGKGYDGRRCPAAFRIGDDNRIAALKYGNAGIGGAKINTENG